MVTETDEIASALDHAAAMWPELKDERAALLRKLISAGISSLDSELEAKKKARIAAIKGQAGMFPAHMWENFREEQLAEWPA